MRTTPLPRVSALAVLALVVPASWGAAQSALSLDDAVARALANNPAIRGAAASEREAGERATQAKAAYLPRLDLTETWQRGNQPVFVFGSLLAQRRFSESNFAIDALNHPDALANYRTAVTVEQVVFDGLRTGAAVRTADLGRRLAELGTRDTESSLRIAATQAYGRLLKAQAERRAAESAVASAEEDVARVERRRDGGMATDADVLALQVHLARMQERAIVAVSQATVASAQLNEVMGEPLDTSFTLVPPVPGPEALPSIEDLEAEAREKRPDLQMAMVREEMARASAAAARSGFFPQASLLGGYEWNGGSFGNRSPSWNVGAYFRWNVFAGTADAARLREAQAAAGRLAAEREQIDTRVRVDLRAARARVEEARARRQVGQSAKAQSQESQRIVRNRYEAGLASLNDLLRAANAVLDADSLYTSAVVDLVISSAQLDRARGR